MFRAFVFMLLALVALSLLRAVIGVIAKAMSGDQVAARRNSAPPAPASGELKRDPVCGSFVPAPTSVTKTVNGELFYFCSTTCRDKYQG